MELGLGLGDFVLDGDPAPPPQKDLAFWLPTCDVISARQSSYPVSALSGVHLPGKSTVWRI